MSRARPRRRQPCCSPVSPPPPPPTRSGPAPGHRPPSTPEKEPPAPPPPLHQDEPLEPRLAVHRGGARRTQRVAHARRWGSDPVGHVLPAAPGQGSQPAAERDVVEQLGGTLELESTLGKGTTPRVRLPIPTNAPP